MTVKLALVVGPSGAFTEPATPGVAEEAKGDASCQHCRTDAFCALVVMAVMLNVDGGAGQLVASASDARVERRTGGAVCIAVLEGDQIRGCVMIFSKGLYEGQGRIRWKGRRRTDMEL